MSDEVNVQIVVDIPADGDVPAFRDAIYFPLDEWNAMPDATVEQAKQARYEAWRKQVLTPAPAAEPVAVSEPSQLQALRDQAAQLVAQLDEAIAQQTTSAEG